MRRCSARICRKWLEFLDKWKEVMKEEEEEEEDVVAEEEEEVVVVVEVRSKGGGIERSVMAVYGHQSPTSQHDPNTRCNFMYVSSLLSLRNCASDATNDRTRTIRLSLITEALYT
jgi:hypothetical protein